VSERWKSGFDRFSVNGKTLLLQLPIWKTVIFRVDLLCTLDFIVSEYRRNSAIFVLAPENGARFGPGDLVILDEAGMSNLEDLQNFMGLARQRGFGVIFSGDDGQLTSVTAGDAFRILKERSGIHVSMLTQIIRQSPDALDGHYLKAAQLLGELTDERTLTVHRTLGWSLAEKKEALNLRR
jgi:hypothetical protein